MYPNTDLISKFLDGYKNGQARNMSIDGDVLFSYNKPVAVRDRDKTLISNRTYWLGGGYYSMATSNHISAIIYACERHKKPFLIVEGWAEVGKKGWQLGSETTNKTVWGLFRRFKSRYYYSGRTKDGWHIADRSIYKDGNVAATKEYLYWCNKACDRCPAKFVCYTDGIKYSGSVFFIVKGNNEKLAKRYLKSELYGIIDFVPTQNLLEMPRGTGFSKWS